MRSKFRRKEFFLPSLVQASSLEGQSCSRMDLRLIPVTFLLCGRLQPQSPQWRHPSSVLQSFRQQEYKQSAMLHSALLHKHALESQFPDVVYQHAPHFLHYLFLQPYSAFLRKGQTQALRIAGCFKSSGKMPFWSSFCVVFICFPGVCPNVFFSLYLPSLTALPPSFFFFPLYFMLSSVTSNHVSYSLGQVTIVPYLDYCTN